MNDNEYSYMNNEIALVSAVFNTLIPKPLYKPKTPSFFSMVTNICRAVYGLPWTTEHI